MTSCAEYPNLQRLSHGQMCPFSLQLPCVQMYPDPLLPCYENFCIFVGCLHLILDELLQNVCVHAFVHVLKYHL